METIDFNALGGADTINVNDLTGTGVKNVNIDLASPPGSGVGDGQADTIVINATSGDDVITVTNTGGVITVSGLAATVTHLRFRSSQRPPRHQWPWGRRCHHRPGAKRHSAHRQRRRRQ